MTRKDPQPNPPTPAPQPPAADEQLTAGDLWRIQTELEQAAARLLGQMIFEFSRLDMNLGLTVVWLNGGNDIPGRTKTAAGMPFNSRLRTIGDAVAKTHPAGSKRRKAWDGWIERAHAARLKRNDLIHGRWGVEPQRRVVTNVIGLPTGEQRETAYRIEDLEGFVAELRKLHGDLWPLREKWPV